MTFGADAFWIVRRLGNSHPNRNQLEKLMAEGGREAAKAVLKHSEATLRYVARFTPDSSKDLLHGHSGLWEGSEVHNRNKLEKLMAEGGREAAKAVLKHFKANKHYVARFTPDSSKDLVRGHSGLWEGSDVRNRNKFKKLMAEGGRLPKLFWNILKQT